MDLQVFLYVQSLTHLLFLSFFAVTQSFAVHGILPPPPLPSVNPTLQQVLIAGAAAENGATNTAEAADDIEKGMEGGATDFVTAESGAGPQTGAGMPPKQKRASSATYPSLASNSGSLL